MRGDDSLMIIFILGVVELVLVAIFCRLDKLADFISKLTVSEPPSYENDPREFNRENTAKH